MVFKKNITTSGKIKDVVTDGEQFIDFESGEVLDLATALFNVYGTEPFDISTTQKTDVELGGD